MACAPSRKFAFLLANFAYTKHPLEKGVKNTTRLAKQLERVGFVCSVYRDLHIEEMRDAYHKFISNLRDGDIVVVYFSGHSKNIGDSMYNSSITPKCRIAVANIFQCIRTQIKTGTCLYIADTCSADKLNCHFADCRPLTREWASKYIDRDKYNIHQMYEHDTKKCKRHRGGVAFAMITSSEPGTVSYDTGVKDVTDFTKAVIWHMSIDRMWSRTSVYTIYDLYMDIVHTQTKTLHEQQPALLVASAHPLVLFCPSCL